VIERLRPIILELERTQCSVVVIAPRAILRVLYSYFAGIEDLQKLPSLNPGNIMNDSGPSMVTELRPHSELGYTINHIRIFDHGACQSIDPGPEDTPGLNTKPPAMLRMGRRGAIASTSLSR
jgi:hypothetical protein